MLCARRSGRGQQVAADLEAVAHHVVEHAAALQVALPEPGHVRAAVLLGRAREVGAPGAAAPRAQTISRAALEARREELVLEIAVQDARLLHELDHAPRLGDVAAERLLAGDAAQVARRASRAATIRSMFSTRAWLGPQIQMAVDRRSATIASMEAKARASPTRSDAGQRRRLLGVRRGSGSTRRARRASRTATHERMWNRVMKPLPMNPTPSLRVMRRASTGEGITRAAVLEWPASPGDPDARQPAGDDTARLAGSVDSSRDPGAAGACAYLPPPNRTAKA